MSRIALVVATVGRPEVVRDLLAGLTTQTRPPDTIVLSVEGPVDLPPCLPEGTVVLEGPRGASAQRNRGLASCLATHDLVVFLDDDFVASRFFFEAVADLFGQHADLVGATGSVLADGVGRGGIAQAEAEHIVAGYDAGPRPPATLEDTHWTYGCNMAFRCAAIGDIRFDEALPLYSWQEDVDFSGRLGRRGRIVRSSAIAGVHRGVSAGRTSGLRFGYSQVVNPVYLVRKGTMRFGHAAALVARNLLANHAGALRTGGPIDRRGRLRGNWIGIADILRGKADPCRILRL